MKDAVQRNKKGKGSKAIKVSLKRHKKLSIILCVVNTYAIIENPPRESTPSIRNANADSLIRGATKLGSDRCVFGELC